MSKLYEGWRDASVGPARVTVTRTGLFEGGCPRPLSPRYDLRNHSPDGYQWSYCGSGPAQLALALLCDALGDDERAQRWYQDFKFARIATLLTDHWTMTEDEIREWVEERERP